MQRCLVLNICCIFVYIPPWEYTFISATPYGLVIDKHKFNIMKQEFIKWCCCMLATMVVFAGCKKLDYEVLSNINIKLTSSAFDAEQVNISVVSVQANYTDTSWVDLSANRQSYNLLDYQNNLDTSIAKGTLPATSILRKIKIVFGNQNTIKLNGKLIPLVTSNNPVVVLDVNRKLNRNIEKVVVAINPILCIGINENGLYQFTPVAAIK